MPLSLICNSRNLFNHLTGVQRYTLELLSRFPGTVDVIAPNRFKQGINGHLWEQFALPLSLNGRLLWSPSNTGPLCVEKQVVSIMDVSPLDHPEWSSPMFSSWYQYLLPRLINRVRSVITISEFSKQRILHYCPKAESKIYVTPLAADTRFKPEITDNILSSINALDFPSSHYVLALGSIEPRKNLISLLNAWSCIQSKLPDDVWLVLAGAKGKDLVFGNYSFGNLPPRVFLAGHIPDYLLPAVYSGALASVYLSLYEGFGLPPLEAMACGTPVVTSNTTSLPEVVGSAALTVNPLDIDAISEALLLIVNDSKARECFKLLGFERARLFNWDKTAKQTWEILEGASKL